MNLYFVCGCLWPFGHPFKKTVGKFPDWRQKLEPTVPKFLSSKAETSGFGSAKKMRDWLRVWNQDFNIRRYEAHFLSSTFLLYSLQQVSKSCSEHGNDLHVNCYVGASSVVSVVSLSDQFHGTDIDTVPGSLVSRLVLLSAKKVGSH